VINRVRIIGAVIVMLLLAGTAVTQRTTPGPLAVVNGEAITAQEIEKAAAQDLQSLELRKVQFDIQLERDRQSAMQDALDSVIKDHLLSAEAKKRKVSVDEFLAVEIDGAITTPGDATIVQFYNENKSGIPGSLAENASDIRQYLRALQRQTLFDDLIARLTEEYGVKSFLEPSRTPIPLAGHPVKGPAVAPVTIVEFSDFECPYCGALFPTLQKIEADYKGKVNVVYYQFPLVSIHPHAQKAAEASLCANEQGKFWQLHDAMFNDQQNLGVDDLKKKASLLSLDTAAFNSCLDNDKFFADIRSDVAEGSNNGISGTPAMFINGRLLVGNQPYADIKKIIEDELRRTASK